MIPTTPENLKKINTMFNKLADPVGSLYVRWQDEKEYEDIKEYGKAIQNWLPKGFTLTRMNKRPFGFNFTIGTDAEYQMFVKGNGISWTRIQ